MDWTGARRMMQRSVVLQIYYLRGVCLNFKRGR